MVGGLVRLRAEVKPATLAAAVALIMATACERPDSDSESGRSRPPLSDSALRAIPGYVVDSILPPDEALRRFQAAIGSAPARLAGPTCREALVKAFFAALDNHDAGALEALGVTKGEFAYLIYPGSSASHRPFYQPPEIAWLLLVKSSATGFSRLLHRAAGGVITYRSHTCAKAERDGESTLYRNCIVHVVEAGKALDRRLFGTIVERDGRFKFLGFDNDY